MKRPPRTFTVTALAAHLHKSRARTHQLVLEAGITLSPVELHYSDERPRTRRNWRPLTQGEVDRVIRLVRARQGARVLRSASRGPSTPADASRTGRPTDPESPESDPSKCPK